MSTAYDALIAERRRLVAQMRLRGLSVREIHAGFEKMARDPAANHIVTNPETRGIWSIGTIHADLKELEAEWREDAVRDIAAHKAQLHAELQHVKAQAWQDKDTTNVLRAIEQQRKLLGADAPQQTQLGGIPGAEPIPLLVDPLAGIDLKSLTLDQLNALQTAVETLDALRANQAGEGGAQPI